jgi:hypothetical protein
VHDVLGRELGPRLVTVATLRKQSLRSYIGSEHNNMDLIGSRVLITQMLQRVKNGSTLTERDTNVGIQDLYSASRALQQYQEGAVFSLNGTILFSTQNFTNVTGPGLQPVQNLTYSDGIVFNFLNRNPGLVEILLSVQVVNNTEHLGYLQFLINGSNFRDLVYEPAGLESTGEVLVARPGLRSGSMEFLVAPRLAPGRFVAPITKGLRRVSSSS